MLRTTKLPTFNSIQTGKTATCDMPRGLRLHTVVLELSDDGTASAGNANDIPATIANLIGDIRIKRNGNTQRTHSGVELNAAVNGSNGPDFVATSSGTAGTAGYRVYLAINFAEPWRTTPALVAAPAWNIVEPANGGDTNSLQIEVDIVAGLTSPNVTGTYDWEPPLPGGIGEISKVIRQSVGALGLNNTFVNFDKTDLLQAMHLFPTVEATPKYVDSLQVKWNGILVQEDISTLQNQVKLINRGLNPDTSAVPRYDWIVDFDDPITSGLPLAGARNFEVKCTYNASAGGNMTILFLKAGRPE
jgi:hypothetical protein